tara:strand:- start:56 stop:376 length:321 start_codon:yes stop_codon:yes gene_type:complete
MGDLVDLQEFRDKKEEEELQKLQEKLQQMIEGLHFVDEHGYYIPLEEAINAYEKNVIADDDTDETPPPVEFSTSRWDHFLKMIDALWLAFRHLWRVIWGPTNEVFF